jgi:hypothetical protein
MFQPQMDTITDILSVNFLSNSDVSLNAAVIVRRSSQGFATAEIHKYLQNTDIFVFMGGQNTGQVIVIPPGEGRLLSFPRTSTDIPVEEIPGVAERTINFVNEKIAESEGRLLQQKFLSEFVKSPQMWARRRITQEFEVKTCGINILRRPTKSESKIRRSERLANQNRHKVWGPESPLYFISSLQGRGLRQLREPPDKTGDYADGDIVCICVAEGWTERPHPRCLERGCYPSHKYYRDNPGSYPGLPRDHSHQVVRPVPDSRRVYVDGTNRQLSLVVKVLDHLDGSSSNLLGRRPLLGSENELFEAG